jgi:2-oxoisovalerate dehydrogenase E1 component
METPIPFINQLENQYLAKGKFEAALREVLGY